MFTARRQNSEVVHRAHIGAAEANHKTYIWRGGIQRLLNNQVKRKAWLKRGRHCLGELLCSGANFIAQHGGVSVIGEHRRKMKHEHACSRQILAWRTVLARMAGMRVVKTRGFVKRYSNQ